jgi:hypothetical protein
MLCRRPALLLRLLPLLALVIAGCQGGGQAATTPTPVPQPSGGLSLSCALGSGDCTWAMLGQTLTFTARQGDGASALRSVVLDYGDGSPVLDLGALTSPATRRHEYSRLGVFTARLDATTAAGEARSAAVTIQVGTVVTASIATTNFGNLNVEAVADVQGAPVVSYEWSFEPFLPPVVTIEPRAVFAYPLPGYKAVELRARLADGRVVTASAAVIVGRENEG